MDGAWSTARAEGRRNSMKLAVHGASGYTGRLVAARLADLGIDHVLVGRDRGRLQAAAAGGAEIRVAALDDATALTGAFAGCATVINCAGPFTTLGEPVVRAAIAAGANYVDTAAEQLYIQRIFDGFGAAAEAAGVTVVPATGYDIVPGDLICHLAGERVEPVAKLRLAYAIRDFGMTRGSTRSVLVMYTGGEVGYAGGAWGEGGGPMRADPVLFPGDAKASVTVRWPAGEIVTVPRHLRVRDLEVVMRGDSLVPGPVAPVAPTLMPVMSAVMRSPLRGGLERLIGRLPEGPSEEKRRRARFAFVAEAVGEDGRRSRGACEGVDVYASTAAIAVEAASRLATGTVAPGVLAPAQAFDPAGFLDSLAGSGLGWSVEAPEATPG